MGTGELLEQCDRPSVVVNLHSLKRNFRIDYPVFLASDILGLGQGKRNKKLSCYYHVSGTVTVVTTLGCVYLLISRLKVPTNLQA